MSSRGKKKWSLRHIKYGRRGKRRSLMATSFGPWVIVIALFIAIGAGVFVLVKFAVPAIFDAIGIEMPGRASQTPDPASITPAPSFHPVAQIKLSDLQKEIVPEQKYVSNPMRFKDEVLYCGGKDETGGPKNSNMYIYNISTKTITPVENIELANDDIFFPQMDDTWFVWLDHSRAGGGLIMAKNRNTGKSFVVKEYYVGQPVITLDGDMVCWVERTGSNMDKVFAYSLASQENVCVAMLEGSVFGQSDCHINNGTLVYANYDASVSSENSADLKGTIYAIKLDKDAESKTIFAGTYVHDPKTNGTSFVWTDANHEVGANLYLSVEGNAPEIIATDVEGYGIGSEFVAYCVDQKLHIYFWGENSFDRTISLNEEQCVFSNVSQDTVFWFDTGLENSSRDILKYAQINEVDDVENTTQKQNSTLSGQQ